MADLKLVINDVKTGRSFQKVIAEAESSYLRGRKIKETIQGDNIGMKGYELIVTGGSDTSGFPMRFDVEGQGRKKPLLTKGPGVRIKVKGMKTRKTLAGNTISSATAQINLKIMKYGTKSVNEIFGVKEENKGEKSKEEKK